MDDKHSYLLKAWETVCKNLDPNSGNTINELSERYPDYQDLIRLLSIYWRTDLDHTPTSRLRYSLSLMTERIDALCAEVSKGE